MSKPGLVIAIDKPRQWSSFQVVNKLKWHIKREFGLKKFKIGHAGTLDPLASGLLLVCVGAATKQIDVLQSGHKLYTGTIGICFSSAQFTLFFIKSLQASSVYLSFGAFCFSDFFFVFTCFKPHNKNRKKYR